MAFPADTPWGIKGTSVPSASRLFVITLGELSVYTMSTSVLMLTLCFANCVSGQWNLNAGPNGFQGTFTPMNGNSGPAFAASSSSIFPPSSDGFFTDSRSAALSNRAGSIDNWNWLNGQNAEGVSFFTSGGAFQPVSHSLNSITTAYYGSPIGSLSTYQHGVSGMVYAVDDQTILVKAFTYDGLIPDAFFYIGTGETAQPYQGTALPATPDESRPLGHYEGQDVVLKLKSGTNLRSYRWLAVMSNSQNSNFGDVMFPRDLSPPKSVSLGQLMSPTGFLPSNGVRSGPVTVLNDKQIQIVNFAYDGQAPDAYFWAGQGPQPNNQGTIVPYQNSYAKLSPIKSQTVTLTLPGNLNVQNVNWLAVWSRMLNANLGYVMIPSGLNVPPSLTGLATQGSSPTGNGGISMDLPNCNTYANGKLQVRWVVQGFDLLVQLKGRIDDRQYMAFGISGTQNQVSMIGSDVVVAYWDANSNTVIAQDFTITARQECMAPVGVCPDQRVGGSNNVDIISSSHADGYTSVTYKRPINTGDRRDLVINPTVDTYIVWAIGPLNRDNYPSKHYEGMRASAEVGEKMHFSTSNPMDNCLTAHESSNVKTFPSGPPNRANENAAWNKQYILGSDTKTFIAVIGPSGGRKGFMAATGKPTWGIVWYVNGKMAPELVLRRGETYQFLIYGGMYPQAQPRFHPFYITTDQSGGFGSKFPADRQREEAAGIVAGIHKFPNGTYQSAAMGQYCAFVPSGSADPDSFMSFEEFNRTLQLHCDGSPPGVLPVGDGVSGLLEWTPSTADPANLYYQCYSHRDMGWKITLVNDYNEYRMPYQDRPQLTEPASGLAQGYPGVANRDLNFISQSNRLCGISASLFLVIVALLLL